MIGRVVLAVLLVATIGGCTFLPTIVIANQSNTVLRLVIDDPSLEGVQEKEIRLYPRQVRKFLFGDLAWGSYRGGVVKVRSGRCSYTYRLPEMPWYEGMNDPPLPVQIEPNMVVYLKRPGRRATPASELPALQRPGFPIQPEKICAAN